MAANIQTETFRGYNKVALLQTQTAVECKFQEEMQSVIASDASVYLSGAEVINGEVRYFGRVHFILVYMDAEKRICRAERGVEFSARAADERCVPAFTARVSAAVENLSLRREGASVYLAALIGADVSLYGEESFDYVAGGDVVCKREPSPVITVHLCGGACESQEEFETEFIGDILLHSETVGAADVTLSAGSLTAEGEISLEILALRHDSLVSFERLVPFRFEIPCDDAAPGRGAEVNVRIVNVSLKAEMDEEHGKCKIFAEFTLDAEACVYEEAEVDTVTDAFSQTHEIALSYAEVQTMGVGGSTFTTERVAGKAALSSHIDFSDTLLAVTLQRAEANLVATESGMRAEGIAAATLIVKGADGEVRGIQMSLPFSVPAEAENCSVHVLVCSMNARQKQEGEIDAEATLKLCFTAKKTARARFVCAVQEGEPVPENNSAVSVYLPGAGDGLWELSKSLKKTPEEVRENNPGLEFPIREGQRVVIYRKKTFPG